MTGTISKLLGGAVFAAVLVALLWQLLPAGDSDEAHNAERLPVPVEVAPIDVGSIVLARTFTGTLEAYAEFVLAPKVAGRIETLRVDLADSVQRDQVLAVLDDAEYVQQVARAEADLALQKASHHEAESLLTISERELQRLQQMRQRGDVSESQLDSARSEHVAHQAQAEVTQAAIARAEADLNMAQVRLGYTQVRAGWQGGSDQRVVAERYVDEGQTVAANTPMLRIVELDPITAVFFVTERDYALLQSGLSASVQTDAYGDEVFVGRVQRVAPVFNEASRQARVELTIDNPELRLKPGMFARAEVILRQQDNAVIVPELALSKRDAEVGIFRVAADGQRAEWHPVDIGIRQHGRVQIIGDVRDGQVVVLGQQQLQDGSALRVVTRGRE